MKGKVGYITGGTKGIGLGVAQAMVEQGMKVAITGTSQQSVDEALAQITQIDQVLGLVCDVTDYNAQASAVDQILDRFGKIDVVIANAGVGHFAPIDEMTLDQWNDTIDINLTGVFYTVKSTLEALKHSQGYYITIASLAGTNFFERGAAYNASKFGLVGFTQAMMLDLRKYDIKTSTIMPGSVSTHFNGNNPSEKDHWKIQPEDIGQMVVDLLRMPSRTLPSKVEVRPSFPHKK